MKCCGISHVLASEWIRFFTWYAILKTARKAKNIGLPGYLQDFVLIVNFSFLCKEKMRKEISHFVSIFLIPLSILNHIAEAKFSNSQSH